VGLKYFVVLLVLAVSPALAQTSGPGPLSYNPLVITNHLTSTATGLTNGMSNGSVRQTYLEFDDATPAGPNFNLTTAFTAHQVEIGPSSGDKVGGIFNVFNCCQSSGGYILGGVDFWVMQYPTSQCPQCLHQ